MVTLRYFKVLVALILTGLLSACAGYKGVLTPSAKSFVALVNEYDAQFKVYYIKDRDDIPTTVVLDVVGDGIELDKGNLLVAESEEGSQILKDAMMLGMETYEIKYLDGVFLRGPIGYLLIERANEAGFNELFAISADVKGTRPVLRQVGDAGDWGGTYQVFKKSQPEEQRDIESGGGGSASAESVGAGGPSGD
jgi:hypothetical protein